MLSAAKVMASRLKGSGYEYINLDCGWSTKHRDPATGNLVVNTTRFPHGVSLRTSTFTRAVSHMFTASKCFGMDSALGLLCNHWRAVFV